jgi:nicotinamidase-related amidase
VTTTTVPLCAIMWVNIAESSQGSRLARCFPGSTGSAGIFRDERWQLPSFRELVDKFLAANVPGLPIIRLLRPKPESDYYILKPCHSGFFRTGLEVLLERLETRTVIVTGFATDICVLFTANDAYMRGFDVVVPRDCVASEREADNDHALRHMTRRLKAEVIASDLLDFQRLGRASGGG